MIHQWPSCCGCVVRGFFLLSNNVQHINNNIKPGACPHGLPAGACPVCSTSGGGTRLSDKNRKVGEMTYHECAMIGNMLKARALAKKNHAQMIENSIINTRNFEKSLQNFAQKTVMFINMLSKSIILKPAAFVLKITILPVLKVLQQIPALIKNIKEFNITDKLNALYGEAKAFLDKKISELVSNIKKGWEWIFKVKKKDNSNDDDTKIDEDKKLFNLKTAINKILKRFKKKKENEDESCTEN